MSETSRRYFETWPQEVPEALRSTVKLLEQSYPDGVPEERLPSVLVVLSEGMSDRQVATLLSLSEGGQYVDWYNDVLDARSRSGGGHIPVEPGVTPR